MELQETGNVGVPKYKKTDYDTTEEEIQRIACKENGKNSSKRYVLVCSIFASLNSVILGYGLYLCLPLFEINGHFVLQYPFFNLFSLNFTSLIYCFCQCDYARNDHLLRMIKVGILKNGKIKLMKNARYLHFSAQDQGFNSRCQEFYISV